MNAAQNFLEFIKTATVRYINDGEVLASPEVVSTRLKTCHACEHLRDWRCQDVVKADGIKPGCGCFVDAKVKFTASQCPQGYW